MTLWNKEKKCITISIETIKNTDIRNERLFSNNSIYYKSLLDDITNLSNNFPIYLSSQVFNKSDVNEIYNLADEIQDVIMFSSEMDLEDGTNLAFKEILFKEMDTILSILDINSNTIISCQHMLYT